MRLYLMRHGIAEDAAPGQSDRDRALTPRGREKLAGQVAALRVLAWPVEKLVTSPVLRARQTAEAIAPLFGLTPVEDGRIGLGASPDAYLAAAGEADADHVLLVGHQPDLETVIFYLTGALSRVRKGTIAVVDLDRLRRGGGRLRAFHDPDELALLGAQFPSSHA